jgi:hypothetical protein
MSIVPPRSKSRKFSYPRYDSQDSLMNRHRLVTILKSKTFWGSVATAVGVVLAAPVITTDVVLQAGGIVLGGAGIRDAITQLGLR